MSRARGVCALVLIDDGAATTRDADVPEEIILQRLRASSEDDDGAATGTLDKNINNLALGSFVKGKLLSLQQLLKAFKPFRFYRLWNLYFGRGGWCSGARAVFK